MELDTHKDGYITVNFPFASNKNMPGGWKAVDFMVFVDDEEADFEEIHKGTVKVDFVANTSKIEIIVLLFG